MNLKMNRWFVVFVFHFIFKNLFLILILVKVVAESSEIDLKCKEKVTDSDTESQSDAEPLLENKTFPHQRFSPVKSTSSSEVTCRPKPIKAR